MRFFSKFFIYSFFTSSVRAGKTEFKKMNDTSIEVAFPEHSHKPILVSRVTHSIQSSKLATSLFLYTVARSANNKNENEGILELVESSNENRLDIDVVFPRLFDLEIELLLDRIEKDEKRYSKFIINVAKLIVI